MLKWHRIRGIFSYEDIFRYLTYFIKFIYKVGVQRQMCYFRQMIGVIIGVIHGNGEEIGIGVN